MNKTPVGIDREIRQLEIRMLVTDDAEEKRRINRKLEAAKRCREFLEKLPGQEYITRDGGEIRTR